MEPVCAILVPEHRAVVVYGNGEMDWVDAHDYPCLFNRDDLDNGRYESVTVDDLLEEILPHGWRREFGMTAVEE